MSIQWFPGHMHATQKAIVKRLPDIDVVVELLDARLPGSSSNPLLAELTHGKPALKVLNKRDLADPELTRSGLPTCSRTWARGRSRSMPASAHRHAC
jgi:ribosome biogenesis GTPase A